MMIDAEDRAELMRAARVIAVTCATSQAARRLLPKDKSIDEPMRRAVDRRLDQLLSTSAVIRGEIARFIDEGGESHSAIAAWAVAAAEAADGAWDADDLN